MAAASPPLPRRLRVGLPMPCLAALVGLCFVFARPPFTHRPFETTRMLSAQLPPEPVAIVVAMLVQSGRRWRGARRRSTPRCR